MGVPIPLRRRKERAPPTISTSHRTSIRSVIFAGCRSITNKQIDTSRYGIIGRNSQHLMPSLQLNNQYAAHSIGDIRCLNCRWTFANKLTIHIIFWCRYEWQQSVGELSAKCNSQQYTNCGETLPDICYCYKRYNFSLINNFYFSKKI